MIRKLLEHKIISDNGHFFCLLCMCRESSFEDALRHIDEDEHQVLKNHQMDNMLRDYMEDTYETLENNNKVAIIVLYNFICLPCNRNFIDLMSILQHIQGNGHMKKLEDENTSFDSDEIKNAISSISDKRKLQVRRKLSGAEVQLLLRYIEPCEKSDSYVNNKCNKRMPFMVFPTLYNFGDKDCETLINNKIIIDEYYQLLCKPCNRCFVTPADILQHLQAKNHTCKSEQANTKLQKRESSKVQLDMTKLEREQEDKHVESSACTVIQIEHQNVNNNNNNNLNLYCELCTCFLPSQDHVLQHINGKQHSMSLKKQSKKQDSNESIILLADTKICNKEKELDVIELQNTYETTTATVTKVTEVKDIGLTVNGGKCKICFSRSCDTNCLKRVEQLLIDSGVVIQGHTNFSCTFCKRNLPSLHNTLLHIKGKSHKNISQGQNVYVSVPKDSTSVNEKTDVNFPCDAIDTDLSQNNGSSNDCYDTDHSTEILISNTHRTDDSTEHENSEILNKSNNDTVFLYSSYFCELCKIKIDIDNLFEHISTVSHRCNIFSLSMGDDIILFKCSCCKSIIQGNSLLIDHLSSPSHVNNLTHHVTCLDTNGIEVYSPTCYSVLNDLEEKSFPLCDILIPSEQSAYTSFNEQCFIFFDMPDIKCHNNIRNNIIYYCSLCAVKLNTDHNLMEHCQAKMHLWKIKRLFLKKYRQNTNNVAAITDRINKISINSKDSQKPNDFNIDFLLTRDVNRQITILLNASPLYTSPEKSPKENKKLTERLNKMYNEKYLDIEEEMYTINERRLNNLKTSLSLIMPYDIKNYYCLVCDKKVSKKSYLLYEHVSLDLHKINEIECMKNKNFEKFCKHYIKEISKNSVKCYPCGNNISNYTDSIDTHVNNSMHRNKHKMFMRVMDNAFNDILEALNNLWYSIQRFSCTLCKTSFNHKLEFIEHIIDVHNEPSNIRVYDFCIPCATLWLSEGNSYTLHCSDITHKYLVRNNDFMVEDLPECMKEILTQVDELSDILFKKTEILSNDNIQQEVKQSLESILKPYFPSIEAFLFGSRVTGLGFENSDIDIYLDCGGTYSQSKNEAVRQNHLRSIKKALHNHKDTWEIYEIIEDTRVPIIKLVYKPTGVHCDISVTNGLAVENSKLIRAMNDAYLPCRKLILFIKKWFSYFNLPLRHGLTNYALAWFVIFYLQTESYLPSIATLIKERNNSRRICGWEVGVAAPKNNNKAVLSTSTLLLGFFKFYSTFDYRHYVICPLIGQPLKKLAFAKLDTLPIEMKPYIEHCVTSQNPEYFRTDSPLCVQDPFDLCQNLTKAVSSITLKYLRQYCADSASTLLSLSK